MNLNVLLPTEPVLLMMAAFRPLTVSGLRGKAELISALAHVGHSKEIEKGQAVRYLVAFFGFMEYLSIFCNALIINGWLGMFNSSIACSSIAILERIQRRPTKVLNCSMKEHLKESHCGIVV